jgi:hypothetical protein
MGVREHLAADRDLELVGELELAAVGQVEHLPRLDEPPDRHGAVVLHLGLDLCDVADIHRTTS